MGRTWAEGAKNSGRQQIDCRSETVRSLIRLSTTTGPGSRALCQDATDSRCRRINEVIPSCADIVKAAEPASLAEGGASVLSLIVACFVCVCV